MDVPSSSVAAPVPVARPGYDADAETAMRRVLPMLASEGVLWLSTVSADGRPHLVPTWFWWDGEAFLLWSKPGAVKVRNLRANPRVMVAVGHPGADFAVGLIEAVAELDAAPVPDAFFAKYGPALGDAGLDPDGYRALYTQAVRIAPTRFVRWRGRSERHAATAEPRSVPAPGGALASFAAWLAGRLDAASARLRGASPSGGASLRLVA